MLQTESRIQIDVSEELIKILFRERLPTHSKAHNVSIKPFDDEWYYARYYSYDLRDSAEEECLYYKCDQFDGLIDLINYLKKKIPAKWTS